MARAATPQVAGVKFKLAGVEYMVPKLNLGQQRRMLAAAARRLEGDEDIDGVIKRSLDVAAIIFERAEPTIADLETVECTLEELRNVCDTVQAFSGMRRDDPGKVAPAAPPA